MAFLTISVTVWPLWLTLKMASVLVADAVSETKQKIERCTPGSAEWELEVMPSVLGLCNETLPLLSEGWGTPVATSFLACWLGALGYFAAFLETGTKASALAMVICALTPVAIAYDAASASTDCNLLSDALTKKRMDGPNNYDHDPLLSLLHEHAIRKVELIKNGQNRQQGLGFTVCTNVVDLKLLGTILIALSGVWTTVVPIMFALRPGAAGESVADICSLTGAVDQSRPCWHRVYCVSSLAFFILHF